MLSVWMSPADGARLFHAALTAENVGHTVVYGSSANTRLWWDLSHRAGARLRPAGRLEPYAEKLIAEQGELDPGNIGARLPGRPLRDATRRSGRTDPWRRRPHHRARPQHDSGTTNSPSDRSRKREHQGAGNCATSHNAPAAAPQPSHPSSGGPPCPNGHTRSRITPATDLVTAAHPL